MRHEIIKLNSEQEYKDILKLLNELGELVYSNLIFHSEGWYTLMYVSGYKQWSLVRSTDLDLNSTDSISYSEFISKYSKKKETIDYKHTVYIKGNLTRGKEVIQKLIDLGGKECTLGGDGIGGFYSIDKENTIRFNMDFKLTKNMTEIFLDEPINEPINKVEVFPGIYVGDVVVSLEIKNHYRKKGDIFKVSKESKKNVLYYSSYRVSSDIVDGWRLATSEEKEAFEKGITNINDIKKEPEEDFSKFIGQWVTYHKWSRKAVCKIRHIKKKEFKNSYNIYFNKSYVNFNLHFSAYWTTDSKDLKILSKEELKDYLPEDVYMKEFPETETEVTIKKFYNVDNTLYGILDSDGNITTFDTKDYIVPTVQHLHTSTSGTNIIDNGRYVPFYHREYLIKDHGLNESYQKNSLENKTTTFEHLPFIQVKPLEIF